MQIMGFTLGTASIIVFVFIIMMLISQFKNVSSIMVFNNYNVFHATCDVYIC